MERKARMKNLGMDGGRTLKFRGIFFSVLMAASPSLAQTWTPVGPQPVNNGGDVNPIQYSGRGSAIALDLAHDPSGNTLYYGAAGGGVWESTNAMGSSASFTSISDPTLSQVVGSIALDTSVNPPVLYVGTGEANNDGDSYYGVGVLKSTDNGAHWSLASTANSGAISFLGLSFSKILVDPGNPQTLVAATVPGSYSGRPVIGTGVNSLSPLSLNPGVFRSTDGGASWNQVASLAGQMVNDLVYDSTRNAYFASVWGRGFFVSMDHGQTWTPLPSPFAGGTPVNTGNFQRANLAVRNGTLYAIISIGTRLSQPSSADTGLVQSIDGGNSWTPIAIPPGGASSIGNDMNYYLFIAAPPASSSLVIGGINPFFTGTVDGMATTWSFPRPPHTDQHAIGIVDASHWFVANDGGIYSTADSGVDWADLNNTLNTIQFYSVSPDSSRAGAFVGGSQDNGTEATSGSLAWGQQVGGDGVFTSADPLDTGVYYSLEGELSTINRITPTGVTGVVSLGIWPAFELIPGAPASMFAAGNQVMIGPSNPPSTGTGWRTISPSFPGSVHYLAPAPSDVNTLYLTEGDLVQKTANAMASSPSWSPLSLPGTDASLGHLAVSPAGPATLYVVKQGFLPGEKIYMSPDGGSNWTNISGNLPNFPVNWVTIDPENANTLYLATDVGVFKATDGGVAGENWQAVGSGLPDAPVLQVKIAGVSRQLVAATHGRGAWTFNIGGTLVPTFTATPTATFPCGVPNGADWIPVTTSAAFSPRSGFGSTVFNSQMWVVGGETPGSSGNVSTMDVWASPDGANWTLMNPAPGFNARQDFKVLSFDPADGLGQRMWLIGGFNPFTTPPNTVYNDVWSSNSTGDGWSLVTANATFPARVGPACVVFNNRMWVMGGGGFDDVWSSGNGSAWVQNAAHVPGFLAGVSDAVVFNGQIWAISQSNQGANPNQVWSSSDGSAWSQAATNTGFTPRDNFAFLSYASRLWVIGGPAGPARFNDIWSSPDGVHWTQVTPGAAFAPRGVEGGGLVFQDEMWAIGGALAPPVPGGPTQFANDVWHSFCGPVATPGAAPGNRFMEIITLQTGQGGVSNGSATVALPAFATLVSSSLTPSSTNGNQLVFNYASLPSGTVQIVLDLAVNASAPGGSPLVSQVTANNASILPGVSPPSFQVLGPAATPTPTPSPSSTFTTTPTPTPTFEFSGDCKDGPCHLRCGTGDDDDLDRRSGGWKRQDQGDGTVRLRWEEARQGFFHHPEGYWVFRASSAQGPYVLIQTLTPSGDTDHDLDESTTDQPGPGSWCYVVRAFGGSPVTASEATEPCCLVVKGGITKTSTPTATPTVSPTGTPASKGSMTATPSLTAGLTPTPAPTQGWKWWKKSDADLVGSGPTPDFGTGVARVLAAPNLSRDGSPIQFQVALGQAGRVELALYSLTGEQVYQSSIEGQAGSNNFVWRLENRSGSPVASGLYVYVVRIGDGSPSTILTGKVAVLR